MFPFFYSALFQPPTRLRPAGSRLAEFLQPGFSRVHPGLQLPQRRLLAQALQAALRTQKQGREDVSLADLTGIMGGGRAAAPHLLQGRLEGRNISQQTGPVQFHLSELGLQGRLSWALSTSTFSIFFHHLKHLSSSADHRRHQPRVGLQVFAQLLTGDHRSMRLPLAAPPGGELGLCSPHHRLDQVFLDQVHIRLLRTRQRAPCVNHPSGPAHPLNQGLQIVTKPGGKSSR